MFDAAGTAHGMIALDSAASSAGRTGHTPIGCFYRPSATPVKCPHFHSSAPCFPLTRSRAANGVASVARYSVGSDASSRTRLKLCARASF